MIVVESISVQAGEFRLDDVSLRVPTGGYAVLMGKTGSGKTTVLEAIIGLRSVRRGRIWLDERDVTHLKPAVRGIGYVPQDGALFSKMTVEDQLGLSLVIRRVPAPAIRQRVRELAELLGISHLLRRKPRGLSGGERQLAVLARALAQQPRILLMDEPAAHLDLGNQGRLLDLVRDLAAAGATVVLTTHDPNLAAAVAGQLRDVPVASQRGQRPAGHFVAAHQENAPRWRARHRRGHRHQPRGPRAGFPERWPFPVAGFRGP